MNTVRVHVYASLTKWGDRLFFADSHHTWDKPFELSTNKLNFPWWTATMEVPSDTKELESKCYILRDKEKIWENFTGNRIVNITDENEVTISFNEFHWDCLVCGDQLTTQPVVCENNHPVHRDCFEAYLTTELSKNNIHFTCLECKDNIVQETWLPHTKATLQLRYEKAEKIASGLAYIECPNVNCTYSVYANATGNSSTASVLDCPDCKAIWCKFCEKQLSSGEAQCTICVEGLRSVFLDIYDAIEEAAGTMCPNCKNRGQKYLEECTHITCNCGTLFCYCCGVSKDDVDTADPYSSDINRLYGHNEDWETLNTRCPMWLSDYSIVYNNWPDDPDKQQKRFHQIKAQKKLKEVKLKTPELNWNRVLELDKSLHMQVEKFLQKNHEITT